MAGNTDSGVFYYGEGVNAHVVDPSTNTDTIFFTLNDYHPAIIMAPAGEDPTDPGQLSRAGGSYHNGYYYFSPEYSSTSGGDPTHAKGVYRIQLSADGKSVIDDPELVLDFEDPAIVTAILTTANAPAPGLPVSVDWGDIAVTSNGGNVTIFGTYLSLDDDTIPASFPFDYRNHMFSYDISSSTFSIDDQGLLGINFTYQMAFDNNGILWVADTDASGNMVPRRYYTMDQSTFDLNAQGTYSTHGLGYGSFDLGSPVCKDLNATIGNRLWLDEDGDGVQDGGEDGIGGATVYLCWSSTTTCDSTTAIYTTTTDSNGGYLFENVNASAFKAAVDTSTLPAGLAPNPTYDEDDGTANPDNETLIELSANEEHMTADFGYNWSSPIDNSNPSMGATGAIGDYIWNDANGDGVQDENETGIGLVTVNLYNDHDNDGVYDNLLTTVMTDNTGHYIFDNIAAGAYVVEVAANTLPAGPSWSQTGDPDEYGSTATAADNLTTAPLVLGPGDILVNTDFGYQPDNGITIGDTIYLDNDADGTEDPGEIGIAGVTVSLINTGTGAVIATAITDEDGKYEFSGLPGGVYTITVTDSNHVLDGLVNTNISGESATSFIGNDNFTFDFGYTPSAHIAGQGLIGDTVFMDINADGIPDTGEGLEGVIVELRDTSGNLLDTATTNENGQYWFGNLSDATYTVVVDTTTLPNTSMGLTNTADPDGGTANESDVVISGGNTDLSQILVIR